MWMVQVHIDELSGFLGGTNIAEECHWGPH